MRRFLALFGGILALALLFAASPRAASADELPELCARVAHEDPPSEPARCALQERTHWAVATLESGGRASSLRPGERSQPEGACAPSPFARGEPDGPPLPLVGTGPLALREPALAQCFLRVNGAADAQGARA